jgi:hypothetical protein
VAVMGALDFLREAQDGAAELAGVIDAPSAS